MCVRLPRFITGLLSLIYLGEQLWESSHQTVTIVPPLFRSMLTGSHPLPCVSTLPSAVHDCTSIKHNVFIKHSSVPISFSLCATDVNFI